jgi:hypothetical protein
LRKARTTEVREYDVCLSFAGEDRPYVEETAAALLESGVRVFYDRYEKVNLWGKDLYQHLDDIYQNAAAYCVVFISRQYARKLWTNHERKSAQARAFKEHSEYLLPVRLDGSSIPGIADTIGYVDAKAMLPRDLALLIVQKIGVPERRFYLPPNPDRLYAALGVKSEIHKYPVYLEAHAFVRALQRMKDEERSLVYDVFDQGCPGHLPKAIHISLDLLQRSTGYARTKLLRILTGMESLGLRCQVRAASKNDHHRTSASDRLIRLGFTVTLVEFTELSMKQYSTDVVSAMFDLVRADRCEDCARDIFLRGDFSLLSCATATPENHGASTRRK